VTVRGEEEPGAPKYALIERERRFLVDRARRPDLDGHPFVLIEDRYIDGTRLRLRRMQDSAAGRILLKLTKKYEAEDPLARPIVTAYLTDEEHRILAALPARTLSKRRHHVKVGTHYFGIDLFLGPLSGLELAEIECPSDGLLRSLVPPEWVLRDVSDDPDFQGGSLALLDAEGLAALLEKAKG
jgi:CYTH domain-containing protein